MGQHRPQIPWGFLVNLLEATPFEAAIGHPPVIFNAAVVAAFGVGKRIPFVGHDLTAHVDASPLPHLHCVDRSLLRRQCLLLRLDDRIEFLRSDGATQRPLPQPLHQAVIQRRTQHIESGLEIVVPRCVGDVESLKKGLRTPGNRIHPLFDSPQPVDHTGQAACTPTEHLRVQATTSRGPGDKKFPDMRGIVSHCQDAHIDNDLALARHEVGKVQPPLVLVHLRVNDRCFDAPAPKIVTHQLRLCD